MYANNLRQPILYVAACLSVVAGAIHVLVVPEHFSEWWGYGAFFVATVITQMAFAPALLHSPRRNLLLAGVAGNLAIVTMWIVSRSIGVPFFGPGAGEIEPVGSLDAICTASELVLTALLLFLVWLSFEEADRVGARHEARDAAVVAETY